MSIDEDRLPSRPLRNWFLAWHMHTGDPPMVIAKGFGLDEEIVAELLGDRPPLMIETRTAFTVCCSLRVDPGTLWTRVDLPHGESFLEVDPPWSEIPSRLVEVLDG